MIDPWLGLLLAKMAIAAGIVVSCSLIAERSGPLLAAMIATLPISAGPVLAFLALEHGPGFIAAAALGGMGANLANSALALVYVLLAQRYGTVASLGAGLTAWFTVATVVRLVQPPVVVMIGLTILAFSGLRWLFRSYLDARPNVQPERLWYAIPLRAAGVALLTATVTTVSAYVGPGWSGTLAALPIVFTSLIVILQPRIGGPAMAAIMANSVLGLMGFGLAFATVNLGAETLGSGPSLLVGLLFSLGWNLALIGLDRSRVTRTTAPRGECGKKTK